MESAERMLMNMSSIEQVWCVAQLLVPNLVGLLVNKYVLLLVYSLTVRIKPLVFKVLFVSIHNG